LYGKIVLLLQNANIRRIRLVVVVGFIMLLPLVPIIVMLHINVVCNAVIGSEGMPWLLKRNLLLWQIGSMVAGARPTSYGKS